MIKISSHVWVEIKCILWSFVWSKLRAAFKESKTSTSRIKSWRVVHWPVPVVDVGGISSLLNNPARIPFSPFGHSDHLSLIFDQCRLKTQTLCCLHVLRKPWVLNTATAERESLNESSWLTAAETWTFSSLGGLSK